MNLLERVADFQNLMLSLRLCGRGKRQSRGYQQLRFGTGEQLMEIHAALLNGTFAWGPYRQFEIRDPKKRLISAAPFRDRVVHTAICQIIEPVLDPLLSESVYACRKSKGNRNAVIDLLLCLRRLGPGRFVMKLDIQRYFESIRHDVLFAKLSEQWPEESLNPLIWSLLKSHPEYGPRGVGLPIGNLSSQLFANFYLASIDERIGQENKDGFYFRYMDDFVIGGPRKSKILDIADAVIERLGAELGLSVPISKRVPLGSGPVPFLGYLLDHASHQPLSRNHRRHQKSVRRLGLAGEPESRIEKTRISYRAWAELEPHLSRRSCQVAVS
jgi:RNA-directed DNA polymerase